MSGLYSPGALVGPVYKTITFTGEANLGAVGAVPLYTVTGDVLIAIKSAKCTVDITENPVPGGATLALGVVGSTSLLIAATTALDLNAGTFWVSNTPTLKGIAIPAALKDIITDQNIIGTVATSVITGGAIRLCLYWMPFSTDANVVAA